MRTRHSPRRPTLLAAVLTTVAALAVPLVAAGPAGAHEANAFITGKITGNGQPLGGVVVSAVIVLDIGDTPSLDVEGTTTTAADGTYRLATPAYTDSYRIRFDTSKATGGTSPTGYTDRCYGGEDDCRYSGTGLQLVAGRTYRGIDVVAPRAAELRGRVVDTLGRGVGRIPVLLFHGSGDNQGPDGNPPYTTAVTDVNGNYRIPHLAAGNAAICYDSVYNQANSTPAPEGYSDRCDAAAVTLTAGAVTTRNATVQGRGAVRGTVVDQFGAPVPGATVVVTNPTDPYFVLPRSATTRSTGVFLVHAVDAGGSLEYCVNAPRFENTCVTDATPPVVRVRPFQTSSIGTFVLHRTS